VNLQEEDSIEAVEPWNEYPVGEPGATFAELIALEEQDGFLR
jgi:hypothetical protein